MSSMTQAMQAAFRAQNCKIADDKVLDDCCALALKFNLRASQLADKYDEYLLGLSSGGSRAVTAKAFVQFEKYLAEALGKENRNNNTKKLHPRPQSMDWEDLPADTPLAKKTFLTKLHASSTPRTPAITPQPGPKSLLTPPPSVITDSAFKTRQNKGHVVASINPKAKDLAVQQLREQAPRSTAVEVQVMGPQLPSVHRFMVDGPETKAGALSDRMQRCAAALEEALGEAPGHPVNAATQEPELMVGRVCCDSEGRLNEQSLLLEGTPSVSEGVRVPLDLSLLPSFRLFPGQVLGVRGINPTGLRVVAHTLYPSVCAPPHPPPASSPTPWSMVVAAGPFTVAADCQYEPLAALLEYCSIAKPDVVLLLGPFVDEAHKLVAQGLLEESFQELFQSQVEARLKSWVEGEGSSSRVLLMPSTRDVLAAPTFPQPPLQLHPSMPSDKVMSVQNPCTFQCEGWAVGATTADILRHLSAAEAQRGAQPDRMGAICSHLASQRSYYPLFPPAPGSFMDTSQYPLLDLPCTPNLLLLPSDLPPMAKLVPALTCTRDTPQQAASQLLCINPGRLSRGDSAGTFAHVRVAAGKGGVEEQVSVEVLKV